MPDRAELRVFLVEAKRRTYATQGGKVPSPRPGAKDLMYQSGEYRYVDSYLGEKDFSGQEVVYHRGVPVWSMNYYGWMLRDEPPAGFIETLREALQRVGTERPYRGPERHTRGAYAYRCGSEGDVNVFRGDESIAYRGDVVYRLYFHGGRIRA